MQLLPLLETSEMYQAQQCIWYFPPPWKGEASPFLSKMRHLQWVWVLFN